MASSQVERRARALCVELARVTGGRLWHWRTADTIGQALGLDEQAADAAIAHAICAGWIVGQGSPPHSICLTDAGRNLAK
jgi:hypothetical protein